MEILISLFILSFVLAGMNAMQIVAYRKTQAVYYADVAIQQMDSIWQKLQILKNTNIQTTVTTWNDLNQQVLPNGRGTVRGSYPLYDIAIFWGDNHFPLTCRKNKIGLSGCLTLAHG